MRFGVSPTARYLVSQPLGPDSNAAPTFEAYRFGADPWGETAELAETVAAEHPELDEVAQNVTR
jgi:hypothetical protein